MDTRTHIQIPLEFWTRSARRSWNSTRARPMSREMTGAPVSFLPPSPLSLAEVGLSLGYLLEVSRVKTSVPAKTRDPARGKKGSPEDLVSKGKPEDSSRRTGAAGSSPHGEAPVRRRVRAKGSVPQEPKVSAPPLAPQDDPDLRDIDPSLPGCASIAWPRGLKGLSAVPTHV